MLNAAITITCGGGGRGIRTPERVTPLTVFKTAAFNHSAIPPTLDVTRFLSALPVTVNHANHVLGCDFVRQSEVLFPQPPGPELASFRQNPLKSPHRPATATRGAFHHSTHQLASFRPHDLPASSQPEIARNLTPRRTGIRPDAGP